MLHLEGLGCGYRDMQAVHDLDLNVEAGSITALLGANGAGKSSTLMCIAGHVEIKTGRIIYQKSDISDSTPMSRVRSGIAVVPEGRRLFPRLSVKENLVVGGYVRPKQRSDGGMAKVMDLFPRLKDRLGQTAGALSGGEQQMLAIGRALMSEPELLLVDELSLGLMPKMVDICYDAITALNRAGMTIILVEQNTHRALEAASQVCVLESGHAVWKGSAGEAAGNQEMINAFLGIR
ncbi:MAG: ABC transporter ATP-binding protein [Deltaproteobacteria bacterium]|nr:MAG: ABC transporter ATP-binding protein [Deltaproteobacteria bacterium]